jgi:hypothetical protein
MARSSSRKRCVAAPHSASTSSFALCGRAHPFCSCMNFCAGSQKRLGGRGKRRFADGAQTRGPRSRRPQRGRRGRSSQAAALDKAHRVAPCAAMQFWHWRTHRILRLSRFSLPKVRVSRPRRRRRRVDVSLSSSGASSRTRMVADTRAQRRWAIRSLITTAKPFVLHNSKTVYNASAHTRTGAAQHDAK